MKFKYVTRFLSADAFAGSSSTIGKGPAATSALLPAAQQGDPPPLPVIMYRAESKTWFSKGWGVSIAKDVERLIIVNRSSAEPIAIPYSFKLSASTGSCSLLAYLPVSETTTVQADLLVQSTMLCDICLGAFISAGPILLPSWSADEEADSISWVPHHASIQSLKASAETNCTICTRFLGLFPDKYVDTIAHAELEGTLSTHDESLSADSSGGVLKEDIPRGTKIGAIPYFSSYGQSYELRVAGYGLESHPWDWWGKRGGQRIGINLRLDSISNTPVHQHMLENKRLMAY